METTPQVRGTIIASTLLVGAMIVGAVAVLTGGETADPPTIDAAPVEVVADEPPPPPDPVVGEVVEVSVRDLSVTNSGLRADGSDADRPVDVDHAAVDAAVAAAAAWVDGHLTAAQDGDGGQLPDGLDGPRAAVGEGLTRPDLATERARYKVAVGVLGQPEWVSVGADVTRVDGSDASATFVFTIDEGTPTLLAVRAGGRAEAPPADTDDGGDDVEGAP